MGEMLVMEKQIYVFMRGRIGNQLFIYAFARELQERLGSNDTEVIIDDTEVLDLNWEDSLQHYSLPNVRYVHNRKELRSFKWIFKYFWVLFAKVFVKIGADYIKKYKRETFLKSFLQKKGILICENGYMDFNPGNKKRYMISGFFQSEKYFPTVKEELRKTFSLADSLTYPGLETLENSNSVCISVKVEHNVGSSLYAVCGKEYWKEAIDYIIATEKDPVFFVCSDNVEYVKENLIDCSKFKVIFQNKDIPVHKTLAAMSRCKHFIIGNTTYGWWAQYMSNNPSKKTIAPNKWMLVDMPIDIYDENWILIDVKKYL